MRPHGSVEKEEKTTLESALVFGRYGIENFFAVGKSFYGACLYQFAKFSFQGSAANVAEPAEYLQILSPLFAFNELRNFLMGLA